jgi:hypothetical protein
LELVFGCVRPIVHISTIFATMSAATKAITAKPRQAAINGKANRTNIQKRDREIAKQLNAERVVPRNKNKGQVASGSSSQSSQESVTSRDIDIDTDSDDDEKDRPIKKVKNCDDLMSLKEIRGHLIRHAIAAGMVMTNSMTLKVQGIVGDTLVYEKELI